MSVPIVDERLLRFLKILQKQMYIGGGIRRALPASSHSAAGGRTQRATYLVQLRYAEMDVVLEYLDPDLTQHRKCNVGNEGGRRE
jgi:hypothetical protein